MQKESISTKNESTEHNKIEKSHLQAKVSIFIRIGKSMKNSTRI